MIYQNRRRKLLLEIPENALVVIATAAQHKRNGDVDFPFRPDSDFWYLTGMTEPDAVAVFSRTEDLIFVRERNPEQEIWEGERFGVEAAAEVLGFSAAFALPELPRILSARLKKNPPVFFTAKNPLLEKSIMPLFKNHKIHSVTKILSELRLYKDDDEIALMQKSATISAGAHIKARKSLPAANFEADIAAVFAAEFTRQNAVFAYPPIVAGGKNACVLHYTKNDQKLQNGDLILIDAGAEYCGYSSDISRTYPVSGTFSPAQKMLYQLVLDAQLAAIDCVRPGEQVNKPHEIASEILANGLLKIGLISNRDALRQFYMHGTGHWIGMDVHDVGDYKINGSYRRYEAGMITTIEPGLYIRPHKKINPDFWHIGIRIEDDVLVTENSHRILSADAPKSIDEIEF